MARTVYAEHLVPDGTYTIVGNDGYDCTIDIADATWACEAKPDSKFPPRPQGTRTAALLIGPNNSRDFQKFAFVEPDGKVIPFRSAADRPMRALAALLTSSDPYQYGFAYARKSNNCFRCGRKLTVESSIVAGLGPDCAEIVGAWFDARREGGEDLPTIPTRAEEPDVLPLAGMPARTAQAERQPELDDTLTFNPTTLTLTAKFRWGSPRFEEKKDIIKRLGGHWDGVNKMWTLRVNTERIADFEGLSWFASYSTIQSGIEALNAKAARNFEASTATNAVFVPNGVCEGLSLRPFQAAGVAYMVESKGLINADEMGLGKTIEALVAAAHLACQRILIICPANLRRNWRREAKTWIKGARIVMLESGQTMNTGMLAWATVVIISYESADADKNPWVLTTPWDAVICDEAHYLKNPKAQRTVNVSAIINGAREGLRLIAMLTGTPILNRPLEAYTLLEMIGREDAVGGFWPFVKTYCNAHQEEVIQKGGKRKKVWNMNGASNLVELNNRLRRNGAFMRRLKADVIKELPAKMWAEVPMAMSAAGEATYVAAERDTIEWMYAQDATIRRLVESAEKEWAKEARDGSDQMASRKSRFIANYIAERKYKAQAVASLVKFEGLKTAAWVAKRESVFEWIDDFLGGSDRKLIVFAHHIATVNEIAARYNAPKIQGGMSGNAVEEGKDRFQNDADCRLIVCNLQAGGVGHTLTAASDVAFVELPWTPALLDQAIDRAHRIGQENSVTGWLLTAERRDSDEPTIDGILVELLTGKRAVVNAVTDGIEPTSDVSVSDALAGRLLATAA